MGGNTGCLTETGTGFTFKLAMEEASRCLLCHDAPCSQACPAGTDPAKFIRSLRFKNVKGAIETIREANILGGSCARVCPHEYLCEEACSRTELDKPIEIGKIQKFLTDYEDQIGMRVLESPEATLEKVAIIGAGPAGLAAAANLALKGYQVTIYESREKAGGWLSYGIPPFRLPQKIVDTDVKYVKELGVEFRFGIKVGQDITIEELQDQGISAFIIATGMQRGRKLNYPGSDLEGILTGVDFLEKARKSEGDYQVPDNIAVIGGGDVAIDCATTSKKLGAKHVSLIYHRSFPEMSANETGVAYAQSLGVNILPNLNTDEFIGENGKVKALKASGIEWDENRNSNIIEDTQIKLKTDWIIGAIGQLAADQSFAGVELDDWGLIVVDEDTGQTNREGFFAAGDITNGGKTVVDAIATGKSVAETVDNYLNVVRELDEAVLQVVSAKEGDE